MKACYLNVVRLAESDVAHTFSELVRLPKCRSSRCGQVIKETRAQTMRERQEKFGQERKFWKLFAQPENFRWPSNALLFDPKRPCNLEANLMAEFSVVWV